MLQVMEETQKGKEGTSLSCALSPQPAPAQGFCPVPASALWGVSGKNWEKPPATDSSHKQSQHQPKARMALPGVRQHGQEQTGLQKPTAMAMVNTETSGQGLQKLLCSRGCHGVILVCGAGGAHSSTPFVTLV